VYCSRRNFDSTGINNVVEPTSNGYLVFYSTIVIGQVRPIIEICGSQPGIIEVTGCHHGTSNPQPVDTVVIDSVHAHPGQGSAAIDTATAGFRRPVDGMGGKEIVCSCLMRVVRVSC